MLESISKNVLKNAAKGGLDLRKSVHENLALIEYCLGNYDKVVEHFLKLRIGEDVPQELLQNPELRHYERGYMFSADERDEDARKEYRKVLELTPNFDNEALKVGFSEIKSLIWHREYESYLKTSLGG